MARFSKLAGVVVVLGAVAAVTILGAGADRVERQARNDITGTPFDKLRTARSDRKARVLAYFDAAHQSAEGITTDRIMMESFAALRQNKGRPDARDDLAIDVHFVTHYGEFFDILFVDREGYVFHSMRQESDYHSNLFDGPLADTKIAQSLRTTETLTFIDYEPYLPSDEPAAFFAVPVFGLGQADRNAERGALEGWFVLQCPLNKLNSILSDRRGLGRTGEVYLVNTEQQMVTQSRFRRDPVDLQLKVDTLAVSTALATGPGERLIRDYRGVQVLSSFEPFELFGTVWVIIAEIDEAEAITEHYKRQKELYSRKLNSAPCDTVYPSAPPPPVNERIKRIDTNEFARASTKETLRTSGVSTCTAIAAVLPNRFGYLAHIGPSDRIYGQPNLGHNDCLGEMLHRLQRYDVRPFELPALEFVIVAVHRKSLYSAVDRLLDLGIELAQIRFAYNPSAQYANVNLTPELPSVMIEWVSATGRVTRTFARQTEDLGSIVKRLAVAPKPSDLHGQLDLADSSKP